MFSIGIQLLVNCGFLLRSKRSLSYKVRVAATYLAYTVFGRAIQALGITSIPAPGAWIYGPTPYWRHFIYGEVFVRNDYYIEVSDHPPIIIDCGANIGMATVYFKTLYPDARVHAFEPDPETFQVLRCNVERNRLSDVVLYNAAVGERDGEATLFVNTEDPTSGQQTLVPEDGLATRITVPMISLGRYLRDLRTDIGDRQIDLLKIDIEGYESVVLHALVEQGTLAMIREMAIEYHHHLRPHDPSRLGAFLQLLEGAGFRYQLRAFGGRWQEKGEHVDVLIRAFRDEPEE